MFLPTCTGDDQVTQVICPASRLIPVTFEPVGRWFEACLKRQRSEHSVSMSEDKNVEEDVLSDEDEGIMIVPL